MSFSQRLGLEPEKKLLQIDGMDDELRCELHNVIRFFENDRCWKAYSPKVKLEEIYSIIWSTSLS